MKEKLIDLKKLDELIKGESDPDDLGEEMFLKAYQEALKGTLLFQVLLDSDEVLEHMDEHEKDLMILGYAMGQHDLELVEFQLNDNTKLH